MTKILLKSILFASLIIGVTSCGLDQYNNSDPAKLKDHNEGNEYVYGIKGDSARQLKNDYPKPADADARAKAIREKMFGGTNGSNTQETGNATPVAANDSTKKDAKATKDTPKKEEATVTKKM